MPPVAEAPLAATSSLLGEGRKRGAPNSDGLPHELTIILTEQNTGRYQSPIKSRSKGEHRSINRMMDRIQDISTAFEGVFSKKPQFVVRAPGRVNLIGEHIDYCGYGVFPMAVEQDILVAAEISSRPKNTLELRNEDTRYQPLICSLSDYTINSSAPKWFDYFLCGVRAIQERFPGKPLPSMKLLVKGTVPPAAGMSSSSALVCASALTALKASGQDLPRDELATLCAKCERYIGVQGGGMDQAICLLASVNTAKLIEFQPKLSAKTVTLPKEAVFVVANSCVEINKGNTSYYNIRVVECRLAAQLILKSKGLPWQKPVILHEIQETFGLDLSQCVDLVRETLHEGVYSLTELCELFEMTQPLFTDWALSEKTKHLTEFKLHDRALHVFSEADRVYKFKDACESNDLETMGKLMRESHSSCRDLYECSHEQLDKIVALVSTMGAHGSRLTGAGWGGCTVTLTTADRTEAIVNALEESFYGPRGLVGAGNVFISTPADGAKYFDIA